MSDKENHNDEMLETTTEIKQGHADVGKFNLAIEVILTIVCLLYLFTHLASPWK